MKLINITLCAILLWNVSYGQDHNCSILGQIKEINLYNGMSINIKKQVSEIQFAHDRKNLIDYIELNSGHVIDSVDIKSVRAMSGLRNPLLEQAFNSVLSEHGFLRARMIGDGSGG